MTVYKAIKKEADAASQLAIALINGTDTVQHRQRDRQGHRREPRRPVRAADARSAIFKDNVKDVIADGFWTKAQICTADYAAACTAAGIS